MLWLLIILCITSFAVLCALLWLKQWELSTGHTVDTEDSWRIRLHDWGQWVILNIVHHAPLVSLNLKRYVVEFAHILTIWIKSSTLYVKCEFDRVWNLLQRIQLSKHYQNNERQASGFLREVSEYKQTLVHHVSRPKLMNREEVVVEEQGSNIKK